MAPIYNIDSLNLEPAKIQAITTTEGSLLIIAGPGAGKTLTLVERIVYLIVVKNTPPEHILVATFTTKAAKELITRVSNRLLELDVKVNLNEIYIGTLHSIFLRILEENRAFTRLKRNYRLLDDFDQKYLIYRLIRNMQKVEDFDLLMGKAIKANNWQKSLILYKLFGKISEEGINTKSLITSSHEHIVALGKCYDIYLEELQNSNCLDFSTIQSETLYLLLNQTDVLKQIQEQIKYIMVDEYQDTNTIQEKILLLLAGDKQNICVVGDDDQALYRFRGASIRNILEFQKNFPKGFCKKIELSINYRSHPDIINFYNEWMRLCDWEHEGQFFRYHKEIKPRQDKEFNNNPSVIKVSSVGTYEHWYEEIYAFLMELKSKKILTDFNQVAFLVRSVKNEHIVGLAHYLEEQGINVFSPRSALFFERKEVKLVLGAIIFLFPTLSDVLKWSDKINLNVWTYYDECKLLFANELRADRQKHNNLLKWCKKKAFAHTPLKENTDYVFSKLFYELLQFPLFQEFLNVDLHSKVYDQRAVYNMALMSQLLTKFEYLQNITILSVDNIDRSLRNFFNEYLRFLYDGGIVEYEDFDEYAPSNCISFMTIHQSKGLEFPIVITDSLNNTPRKQYTDIDTILQNEFSEKPPFEPLEQVKFYDFYRLYYTAYSRPQNLLVLSAREKEGRGRTPSKYFAPLYKKLPDWRSDVFKLDQLQLKQVKSVNIKKQYSFTSHILLYENCPLQYKFYKALEFSPVRNAAVVFGILVHQTIEDIHKHILTGKADLVKNDNIKNWFNDNYLTLIKRFRTYLAPAQKNAALKQVLNYKERHKHEWHLIKEAEVEVSLVKEEYILKGTIDLIQGSNNTVEIVDFKGEKKPDINNPDDKKKLERYRRQLEIYAHLVEEKQKHKVSKMHLYYTGANNENPFISFSKSDATITKTIKNFDEVVHKIESKNYDMTNIVKNNKLCGNCDFRYYCHEANNLTI